MRLLCIICRSSRGGIVSHVRNRDRVYRAASEAIDILERAQVTCPAAREALATLRAGFVPVCEVYSWRAQAHCKLDKGHDGDHHYEGEAHPSPSYRGRR